MMSNMKKVLEQMGWSDGYHVPVANAENLKLEAEVERLTLAKAKAAVKFETDSTKCTDLDKFLKRLNAEQGKNQNILLTHNTQIETEKTLYISAKAEKRNFSREIKKFSKEYEKTENERKEKLKKLKNLLTKLDALKISVEWDEQTIENLENTLLQKHEDNELIRRFSKEDRKKANDLELKRQRLQMEEHAKKQLIMRFCNDLNEMELIIKRSIQIHRKMHNEKTNFVRQWKESIKCLQIRDEQILQFRRDIISVNDILESKLKILDEQRLTHEKLISYNNETAAKFTTFYNTEAEMTAELTKFTNLCNEYFSEKSLMKNELKRTANLLHKNRIKVKDIQKKFPEKQKTIDALKMQITELIAKEKNIKVEHDAQVSYIKTLEEILRAEEALTKKVEWTKYGAHKYEYQTRDTLNQLLVLRKNMTSEIDSYKTVYRNIKLTKKSLHDKFVFQKIFDYKLSSKMEKYRKKIFFMEGLDNISESTWLKLTETMEKFQEMKSNHRLICDFMKYGYKEISRLEREIHAESPIYNKLDETNKNYKLFMKHEIKTKKRLTNTLQQLQVEENVASMKLRHAEKVLEKQGHNIYDLKKQQLELETAMKERISEIDINKKVLLLTKNALSDEIGQINSAIGATQTKINIFKNRYDTVLMTMGRLEDGQIASIEYFWLKALQEKTMLQEEGDKLDSQIKQAEQEIIAMENTLKAVSMTNETYKKSLSLVQENDEILTEIEQSENELCTTSKTLFNLRNKLQALQKKLQAKQTKIDENETKLQDITKRFSEREKKYLTMTEEAEYRYSKLDRAKKQLKKLISSYSLDVNLEKDFTTHKLKDHNRLGIEHLYETSLKYLETKPYIERYLCQKKLMLPSGVCTACCSYSISTPTSSSESMVSSVTLDIDIP